MAKKNGGVNECWVAIPGWPTYEAGDHGHIRVRAALGKHGYILPYTTNAQGVQYVTLTYRNMQRELQVDRLICEAYHGPPPYAYTNVVHGDGIIWNHWQASLRWKMEMHERDILWTIVRGDQPCVWRTDYFATRTAMIVGDILLGYIPKESRMCAFEVKVYRGSDPFNPFSHVKYLRAIAKMIADREMMKGDSTVASSAMKTPADAVAQYRKFASMHSEFMWASYLAEAADIIEHMAGIAYSGVVAKIPPPAALPVSPKRRATFPRLSTPETARPPVALPQGGARPRPSFTRIEAPTRPPLPSR